MTETKIKAAILGASGYAGAELIRLLVNHPNVSIEALTADRKAGQDLYSVYPHLGHLGLPKLVEVQDVALDHMDVIFCALPHATTQKVVPDLPRTVKIIDLSADFRLEDPAAYEYWYGGPHKAMDLQVEAVYGLTEFYREKIKSARLVAVPGCYPTCAELALVPLLQKGLIDPDRIIIDAKTGVTGAGRALKENLLFAEVAEGVNAYGVGHHRHMSELDQELTKAAGQEVRASFTPHLLPMNRGIIETIYVETKMGLKAEALHTTLAACYEGEAFVNVLPYGDVPSTREVRGSNFCHIGVAADRVSGRAIVVSVIDNLVKGTSGQAIQNMNLMFDLDERTGLYQLPLFP